MKIGIIGAGHIGQALAKKLTNAGYPVVISNSRGIESLQPLVNELGALATAGTNEDVAQADMVILAVRWEQMNNVLNQIKEPLAGKVVVDASNYSNDPSYPRLERSATAVVAEQIPDSKVVKAFNALYSKWLDANPRVENGKRVSFISGDSPSAKETVGKIITDMGFKVVDLGNLEQAAPLTDFGKTFSGMNLVSYPS